MSARLAAHAIGLVTHASPALHGEDRTEAYLTQPAIMADAVYGPLSFAGMLNLEGQTLKRGELNAGVWGEGYVDRRHPHTYLHEAILTYQAAVRDAGVSLSAGRGFAPFGTDDPMVRGFIKYPSNHHLAQILERLVAIGALRYRGVVVEAGLFNGDEPLKPDDLGTLDRFGDSWSARATAYAAPWLELQASYADVTSPEQPFGGGLDHRVWNVSARVDREAADKGLYALIEIGRAGEFSAGTEIFSFHTVLAEAAARIGGWRTAARFERSDRPEEERLTDLFRSVRPATDNNILGTTRWTSVGVQIARRLSLGPVRAEPLLEVSRLYARPNERPAIYEPENLYGSARLWSVSLAIRTTLGPWHARMGRYGVARPAHQQIH